LTSADSLSAESEAKSKGHTTDRQELAARVRTPFLAQIASAWRFGEKTPIISTPKKYEVETKTWSTFSPLPRASAPLRMSASPAFVLLTPHFLRSIFTPGLECRPTRANWLPSASNPNPQLPTRRLSPPPQSATAPPRPTGPPPLPTRAPALDPHRAATYRPLRVASTSPPLHATGNSPSLTPSPPCLRSTTPRPRLHSAEPRTAGPPLEK
jgi:hypothetical protein